MSAEELKMMPLFLKRRHVLLITGWSKNHFYKLVAAGSLRPVRSVQLGPHQYFKRSDLERLLA